MSRLRVCSWACVAGLLLLLPSAAVAYRPFVSTDAAVADVDAMEVELGAFTIEHAAEGNTFIVPQLVLNYGFIEGWELVGELAAERSPDDHVDLVDPSLSVKHVLKEGVLQGDSGVSIAVELEALLPGPLSGEGRLGFEGAGILSGRMAPLMYHLNLGGGITRQTDGFGLWGLILEFPVHARLRLVGEINGEGIENESPDSSGLLGCIWQVPESDVFVDAAVRRGISSDAPDWTFTTGVTFSFGLHCDH